MNWITKQINYKTIEYLRIKGVLVSIEWRILRRVACMRERNIFGETHLLWHPCRVVMHSHNSREVFFVWEHLFFRQWIQVGIDEMYEMAQQARYRFWGSMKCTKLVMGKMFEIGPKISKLSTDYYLAPLRKWPHDLVICAVSLLPFFLGFKMFYYFWIISGLRYFQWHIEWTDNRNRERSSTATEKEDLRMLNSNSRLLFCYFKQTLYFNK